MKYALISDVHGNVPALEAVLADVDARGDADVVYHLGRLSNKGWYVLLMPAPAA